MIQAFTDSHRAVNRNDRLFGTIRGTHFSSPIHPCRTPISTVGCSSIKRLARGYRADCEYRGRIRGHQRRVKNLHCPGRQRL